MGRFIAGFGAVYVLVILACSVGWIMNLIKLVALAHMDHPNLVMAAIRVVCAFTFLPAGIVGWIPN